MFCNNTGSYWPGLIPKGHVTESFHFYGLLFQWCFPVILLFFLECNLQIYLSSGHRKFHMTTGRDRDWDRWVPLLSAFSSLLQCLTHVCVHICIVFWKSGQLGKRGLIHIAKPRGSPIIPPLMVSFPILLPFAPRSGGMWNKCASDGWGVLWTLKVLDSHKYESICIPQ